MMMLIPFLLSVAAASPPVSDQDTTVLRASNAPVWGPTVRITREARIGEVEGSEEYTFGRIAGIAVGADGSIFVLDQQVPIVRHYNALGKYVRGYGRRGQGPGELAQPEAIAVLGDRLVVRDTRNGRFVAFSLRGEEPMHWEYQKYSYSNYPIITHADGSVSTRFTVNRGAGEIPSGPAVLRYRANGSIRDTLFPPRFAPPAPQLRATGTSSGRVVGMVSYSIPYYPSQVWTYTSRGTMMGGDPSRYSIVIVDGNRVTRIDRPGIKAVPIGDDERKAAHESTESSLRQTDPAYRWNGPPIPTLKPYYHRILVDPDDRIWVQLSTPSRKIEPTATNRDPVWVEDPVYDVISGAGQYLGQVRFPQNFTLHYVRGDQVWGTERDELGVQYVVRYRLQIPTTPTRRG